MRRLLFALALAPACYRDRPPAPLAPLAPASPPTLTAPASFATCPVRSAPPPAARVSAETPTMQSEELVRADRFFADLMTGEPLYEQVARLQENAEWERYRLAWAHLKCHEPQPALEQLHWLAIHASKPALRRAAKRELVFAYRHVGRPDRALAFFDRVDPARAFELLRLLSAEYLAAEQHANARTVLRAIVTGDPDPTRACVAQVELLRVASLIGTPADVLAEAELLIREVATGGDECHTVAEGLVATLAHEWHRERRESNRPRADLIRLWDHAETLATSDAGRDTAAHKRAKLLEPRGDE